MYGYVRPLRDELKLREYDQFRGVYCGLCHRLKKRYGPIFRFAVNYDLTFLAMLLAGEDEQNTSLLRCPYHPFRKTACPNGCDSLDAAADYTVILAYWKMRDGVRDERFLKSLAFRILSAVMKPAYKKASSLRPDFAGETKDNLDALTALEEEKTDCLDAVADKFACILRAASDGAADSEQKRILRELLYHLGRIVYILDAADDFSDDAKNGAYNPLLYRFSLTEGRVQEEDEAILRQSLQHSHNSICAAYALFPGNPYKSILDNIIYYGLPAVTQSVFSGEWRASRHRKRGWNRL